MATFSFHETKNVISGEGGALTLNHPDLIERAEIMRDKGTNRSRFMRGQVDKYTWVDIGSSFLPGELVASYLYGQLEHVDLITQRRNMLFNYYYQAFEDLARSGRVSLPQWADYAVGNGHIFYLRLHGPKDRNAFIEHMRSQGIMTPFHYVPLHTSPAGRRLGRFDAPLSVTDAVSNSLVRLPIYFGLGRDVRKVIDAAYSYLENRLQVAI
jgi:dTDP-4-amino-4,6-dideoxygalactose transaminase